ncbi:MAG: hypothetical protein L0332_19385 [Chloroflexi bacterium]|nr:hypothetical protein [Chloroflexota bacterium]
MTDKSPSPTEQPADDSWLPLALDELARLDSSGGGHIAKKKQTVIAVVEAMITPGDSVNALFTDNERRIAAGLCSYTIWKVKWSKDPLIISVLHNVLKIAREWHDTAELRAMKQRREEWQERARKLAQEMVTKVEGMLGHPLEIEVIEEDDEGRPIKLAVPAKWTFDTVPRLALAADKIARLSLEMPTEKTEQTGTVGVKHALAVEDLGEEELDDVLANLLAAAGVRLPEESD